MIIDDAADIISMPRLCYIFIFVSPLIISPPFTPFWLFLLYYCFTYTDAWFLIIAFDFISISFSPAFRFITLFSLSLDWCRPHSYFIYIAFFHTPRFVIFTVTYIDYCCHVYAADTPLMIFAFWFIFFADASRLIFISPWFYDALFSFSFLWFSIIIDAIIFAIISLYFIFYIFSSLITFIIYLRHYYMLALFRHYFYWCRFIFDFHAFACYWLFDYFLMPLFLYFIDYVCLRHISEIFLIIDAIDYFFAILHRGIIFHFAIFRCRRRHLRFDSCHYYYAILIDAAIIFIIFIDLFSVLIIIIYADAIIFFMIISMIRFIYAITLFIYLFSDYLPYFAIFQSRLAVMLIDASPRGLRRLRHAWFSSLRHCLRCLLMPPLRAALTLMFSRCYYFMPCRLPHFRHVAILLLIDADYLFWCWLFSPTFYFILLFDIYYIADISKISLPY